jgi:hypothetical protein
MAAGSAPLAEAVRTAPTEFTAAAQRAFADGGAHLPAASSCFQRPIPQYRC